MDVGYRLLEHTADVGLTGWGPDPAVAFAQAAKRASTGVDIAGRLQAQGVLVRAQNRATLTEEASEANKDVRDVVHAWRRRGSRVWSRNSGRWR